MLAGEVEERGWGSRRMTAACVLLASSLPLCPPLTLISGTLAFTTLHQSPSLQLSHPNAAPRKIQGGFTSERMDTSLWEGDASGGTHLAAQLHLSSRAWAGDEL